MPPPNVGNHGVYMDPWAPECMKILGKMPFSESQNRRKHAVIERDVWDSRNRRTRHMYTTRPVLLWEGHLSWVGLALNLQLEKMIWENSSWR